MPDEDGPSDHELLRRHVAGDSDAFGELFRRHRDRLWAVALRTLCDPEEAADALQDAMVSAFRRAADFRGESAVTTWLHRIVVNAALDRIRRRAARPAVSAGDEEAFEALVAQDGDPAGTADTRLDVDAALRMLPAQQRAALVVVDMLGFSVADAAAILDTAPGTVKSRCARARARLLPYLAHLQGNRSTSESVSPAQGGATTYERSGGERAAEHEKADDPSGNRRAGRVPRGTHHRAARYQDRRAPGQAAIGAPPSTTSSPGSPRCSPPSRRLPCPTAWPSGLTPYLRPR